MNLKLRLAKLEEQQNGPIEVKVFIVDGEWQPEQKKEAEKNDQQGGVNLVLWLES